MENNTINKHKTNQIEIIKLLKQTAKEILSDDKIHEKIKPTLLSNFTNKLIQLIEEIEEIEKMDLHLLQKNVEQFQKKEIPQDEQILLEGQNLRDQIFCSFFFTPNNKKLTSQLLTLLKKNKNIFENSP